MKTIAPSRVNAETSDVPIARLDAQDIEQALPIREYLEQNGVAVIVGRKPAIAEVYHVICGDPDFVKETIAGVETYSVKPLVVLFLQHRQTVPVELVGIDAKIAVLSGKTVSARDVPVIFAYFFTGEEDIFYMDTSAAPMMEVKPVEEILPIVRESLLPDAARVTRVIGEMFGEKHQKEKSKEYHRLDPRLSARGGPASGWRGDDKEQNGEERRPRQKRLNLGLPRFTLKKIGAIKVILFGLLLMFAPIVWYLVSLGMIAGAQWYGVTAGRRGDGSRLPMVAGVTSYWIGQGRGALGIAGVPMGWVGAGDMIRSHERLLSVMSDLVTAEQKAAALLAESGSLASALVVREDTQAHDDGSAVSLPVIMDRTRLSLEGAADALGLAGAQLRLVARDSSFPFGLGRVRELVARAEGDVSRALASVADLRSLLALYRAAGGFDQKKTYLILLQNSMELRPTGGFIGSVAIVSVEEGVMETPVVQDVYALDGQLKGHVDPPTPVKELLRQEHWYLRDSNWDPDFRVSGEKAAWFYEKETGQTVDGVVAITSSLLTQLLAVTGPIDLPDYNDRVTRENFFGKSLFYTKADFFPGSTQKKDFLGSLTTAILGRVTRGNHADAAGVLRVMMRELAAGEIQFWFPHIQAQAIAEQAGWAGALVRTVPCETVEPSCMVERIGLVEGNMGVNKVNFFITRSVKSRVDISDDGGIDGTIAITYQNTSTDDAALTGGGTYLTYLRAYLPPDALVVSATLDGEEIPTTNAKDRTVPYRDPDETVDGSAVAGFAFTVPPASARTVTITYRRGIPISFEDGQAEFAIVFRKQPGVTDAPLDLAIGYPAGWRGETGLLANAAEVRYNTVLDTTKTFVVKFKK